MKHYLEVTDTSEANAKLTLDSLQFKYNNTFRTLETYGRLADDLVIAMKSGGGAAATTYSVWFDFPGEIQGWQYTNQAAAVQTPVPTVLSDDKRSLYGNFNDVTVDMFEAGKAYLIPYTAGAVTGIMPQPGSVIIESATDSPFSFTHYLYKCLESHPPRNGNSFTGIMFDVNPENAARIAVKKNQAPLIRDNGFLALAAGPNVQIVREILEGRRA